MLLNPPVLIRLRGRPWAVSAISACIPDEGHRSGDHLVLAHSSVIRSAASTGVHVAAPAAHEWFDSVSGRPVPVRVHSECLLGDVFGSDSCDCGDHLARATEYILRHGDGIIIYLRQEGRGIGLVPKLESLRGARHFDTYQRNVAAGYPEDARKFDMVAEILKCVALRSVALISESPYKYADLERCGIYVDSVVQMPRPLTPDSAAEALAKLRRGYHLAWSEAELLELIQEGE